MPPAYLTQIDNPFAQKRLEHRRLGLLELEKQRIVVVAAEHQHDPRPCADAADPDHLARRVDVAKPLQQMFAVTLQRAPVATVDGARELLDIAAAGEVLDRHDQRRVADNPRLAIDDRRQLAERPQAVLRPRLSEILLHQLAALDARGAPELTDQRIDVDPRIPQVERLIDDSARIASR